MALRARLALAGALIWFAILAAFAQAASDHAVSIQGVAFKDASTGTGLTVIDPGDTVTWTWNGSGLDLHHSVTSDPGSAQTFDSDASNPTHTHTTGQTFQVTFPTSGCFQYHCEVHATMHGQVQVGLAMCPPPSGGGGAGGGGGGNGPPPPPPPGPSGQPDTVAPAFSAVSAKGGKKLVFKLSEAGRVTIKVLRGKKTVKTFKVSGKQGSNSFRLTHRGLKHGKYKITLTATDSAGNKSPLKSVRVKL
jgi:plastocyanin